MENIIFLYTGELFMGNISFNIIIMKKEKKQKERRVVNDFVLDTSTGLTLSKYLRNLNKVPPCTKIN